ncbi:hypothetical protein APHAL10511_008221 [Amanita phalloides]|nr:hypothetical protein APHAL10511_008221 [Amanita phalloides]
MSISGSRGGVLKRANPSTIQDKFLVGYQGWFTCAGDGDPVGPGHHGWLHWFNYPLPDGGRPNFDLCPDVSAYSPSELFAAPGLKSANGEQLFLFSSRHPKTVQRHFHWMAEHGIDGAFLQRFAGQCDLKAGQEGIRRIRDEIGDRVQEAAEKEGRVFAIMYDVTGVDPTRIADIIERDWVHLLHEKYILDSPNYLKESGKAVVALWGFGFDNAGHTPQIVRAVTSFLRSNTPGGVYLMAGVPSRWRTSEGDADRNPEFIDVWLSEFDAISPWTVGRYSNEDEADKFAEDKMKGDIELLRRRYESGLSKKIDYIPVVLPGGSGNNLSQGKWGFNNIRRNGGRFIWQQIVNARRLGARIMYGAMWDEYDEGTAILPAVPNKRLLPVHDSFPFMGLDADGYDVPSDWYMRICGLAAEVLRSERLIHESFPVKELQDYWSSRPRFEECLKEDNDQLSSTSSMPGNSSHEPIIAQSYQDWLTSQKDGNEEAPPPPYTLVEEGDQASDRPATTATLNLLSPASASSQVTSLPPPTVPASPASSSTSNLHMASSHHPVTNDPVTSLADELGRQTISGASDPSPVSQLSRPPMHPAHPAAYLQIPQPFWPLSYTPRPTSTQPQSPQAHNLETGISLPTIAPGLNPAEPQSSGPWSQTPWTPSQDFHTTFTGQINDYQHQASGSSSFPENFLKPHSSIGAPSGRPYSPAYITTPTSSAPPNFPEPSSGEPYRPSTSAFPHGNISMPFPSTLNNAASPTLGYSGQTSMGGPLHSGAHGQETSRPYTSPSYDQTHIDYYSNYSGRPVSGPSSATNEYDGQQYQYGSGYSPSYVPYHGSHNQSYGAPNHGVNSYPSTGQYSSMTPTPALGRPPYAAGAPTGTRFSPGGIASNAINVVLSAADRVAGPNTRRQLEHGVDNLAKSGTKLFNKLTR